MPIRSLLICGGICVIIVAIAVPYVLVTREKDGSTDEPMVYITTTDGCYHLKDCPGLGADAKAYPKSKVVQKEYRPCEVCGKGKGVRLVITREKFQKIREVMSLEKVQDVIGAPGEDWVRMDTVKQGPIKLIWWRWQDEDGNRITAQFCNNRMALADFHKGASLPD